MYTNSVKAFLRCIMNEAIDNNIKEGDFKADFSAHKIRIDTRIVQIVDALFQELHSNRSDIPYGLNTYLMLKDKAWFSNNDKEEVIFQKYYRWFDDKIFCVKYNKAKNYFVVTY